MEVVEIRRPDFLGNDICDDAAKFQSYLFRKLEDGWIQEDIMTFLDDKIIVFAFVHPEKERSIVIDQYQLYVWVRSKGFASTDSYKTNIDRQSSFRGLRHHGVCFSVVMTEINSEALVFNINVKDKFFNWHANHDFKVKSHKNHRFAFKELAQ